MKKQVHLLFFLVSLPIFLNGQKLVPGFGYARFSHPGIHGVYFSNELRISASEFEMDIGICLLIGRGNHGIDMNKGNNYSFGYGQRYIPYIVGGSAADFPINLNPLTSTSDQVNLNIGYRRPLKVKTSSIEMCVGGYFSYTLSHFLVGTMYNQDVHFYSWNIEDGSPVAHFATREYDLVFPVYLRYVNAGVYAGAEWLLLKGKATPVGVALNYYAGLKRKHIITFGINLHLPVKSNAE